MWSFPWKKENRELINSQEMENKIYIEIGIPYNKLIKQLALFF